MQTSLPLDATVLRDRHTSTWNADASGSSYGRAYYCQNFIGGRGDVIAVLASDGKLSQQVRYSAYGVPTGIPAGDTNADGSIVGTPDITQMNAWNGTSEVRGDLDLDGDCDNDDMTVLTSNFAQGLGWNKLSVHPDSSLTGVKGGHRKGYCGYEHSLLNHSVMHVRNRVYFAELGRWTRRDPLGYVDGMSLYNYVRGRPLVGKDELGLQDWLPVNPPILLPVAPPPLPLPMPIDPQWVGPDWSFRPRRKEFACDQWRTDCTGSSSGITLPGIPPPSCTNGSDPRVVEALIRAEQMYQCACPSSETFTSCGFASSPCRVRDGQGQGHRCTRWLPSAQSTLIREWGVDDAPQISYTTSDGVFCQGTVPRSCSCKEYHTGPGVCQWSTTNDF